MKVALVHDYLFDYGGAERVLEALHEIWPKAPVFTSFYSPDSLGKHAKRFEDWDIRTSWFDNLPYPEKIVSPLRFLAPLVWKSLAKQLREYDLVISSAAWFVTKGFINHGHLRGGVAPAAHLGGGKHPIEICYCHTPPRYLYGYQTSRNWKKYWPIRVYGLVVNHFLRQYDFWQAQKVDYFVANSQETASRIKKFYRRDARVIFPPVDLPKVKISDWQKGDYYLYVGKLSEAKRVDLAIKACKKLSLNLKVVGGGPWKQYLENISGPKTEFLGKVSDKKLWSLYKNARALIFPAVEEDFGIVPVEAQSYGKPVVAYRSGGVKETVIEGKTGVFFDQLNTKAVIEAIEKLEKSSIKSSDCYQQAEKFSKPRFKQEMKDYVNDLLA